MATSDFKGKLRLAVVHCEEDDTKKFRKKSVELKWNKWSQAMNFRQGYDVLKMFHKHQGR